MCSQTCPSVNGPVRGKVLERRLLVPQRPLHGGDKPGGGPGIPGSEQRDLVAASDQLLGQRADNPLGAAVAGGRHTAPLWAGFSANGCWGQKLPLVGSAPRSVRAAPLAMAGVGGSRRSRCARPGAPSLHMVSRAWCARLALTALDYLVHYPWREAAKAPVG